VKATFTYERFPSILGRELVRE